MNKILLAVNGTIGSKNAVENFIKLFSNNFPKETVLLYVEKYSASFLMDEMLGDSELVELKEALKDSEYQQTLDKRANATLSNYKNLLEQNGANNVRTLIKLGHPPEEIINTANSEEVDIIIMGCRGKRFEPLMMGSVSREVANSAAQPVLLVK